MVGMDFDFARYVNYRRGMVEQRARDGAAYAFAGERKMRRALTSTRPVIIAIEATTRLWKSNARRDLLARATKVSDQSHPRLFAASAAAGQALGLEPPALYLADDFPVAAAALGTDEDTVIMVSRPAADRLDQREMVALVGHELGHVQNNHVPYTTSLFYLRHEALFFVRWIVQPAVMALQAWSRRAEITCDRAGLIAVRDLDVTLASMVKVAIDAGAAPDIRAHLEELASARSAVGKVGDLFRSHPFLPKRARALEVFAESQLYKKLIGQGDAGGLGSEEVDTRVAEIMRMFA